MEIIKLEELSTEDLIRIDAWKIVEESYQDYEILLTPADKEGDDLISRNVGQVWCLTNAIFANGETHISCSLCEGYSDDGPRLWAVWNGVDFVELKVPPAPDFVLEVAGPDNFLNEFGKSSDEVFPLTFEVVPRFQTEPHQRKVVIQLDGSKLEPAK